MNVKISANEAIPQCSKYQQMLANEKLKKEFISYLMKQFIELGEDSNLSANIILDYEDIECPCAICDQIWVNPPYGIFSEIEFDA